MTILLASETSGGVEALDTVAKSLTALGAIGDVHLLVFGTAESAAQAATLSGVSKVLHAADESYVHGLAEPAAALIASLAQNYTHIAAPSTSFGKSTLPRVAALLDVMVISDVSAVIDQETFERSVYSGSAVQTVKSGDSIKVFTLRTAGLSAVASGGNVAIEIVSGPDVALSSWVEDQVVKSDRPELTSAKVVVSGGRGVGSKDNFALIGSLADKMGGAVGASRAAVDSGYASSEQQVGQTGKIVAPDLYVAVGISGAIQHLAGMKDSKLIVAINKDEDAPIFQIADIGLVGDLNEILPELTSKL
ncbi:electron transfer flavoprotein subunit alpha/FixB family protein [Ochrobactrum sp. XJ1]|nr:electron transfer flavoprotein subunit alpha/FixB family protein [Ochrobactrum sp. XJ1]